MANKDLAVAKTFEERMIDRIRDGIGDMMTDEELAKIVQRGIEKVFFTAPAAGYGQTMDDLATKIVKATMRPMVEEAVREEVAKRKDEMQELVRRVVSEGIGAAMLNALQFRFQQDMNQLQDNIVNRIANGY